jgi:hypothetical protein
MTSWSSRPGVSCQSCGTKQKLIDAMFSFVLGWWGVPWGILMTPIQVGRNLFGLFSRPDPLQPSAGLQRILRLTLAEQVLKNQRPS